MKGNEKKKAFISFLESGLFNELRRIQIKKIPLCRRPLEMSHALLPSDAMRRGRHAVARISIARSLVTRKWIVRKNCFSALGRGSASFARRLAARQRKLLGYRSRRFRRRSDSLGVGATSMNERLFPARPSSRSQRRSFERAGRSRPRAPLLAISACPGRRRRRRDDGCRGRAGTYGRGRNRSRNRGL
jgi:hypothetical protein